MAFFDSQFFTFHSVEGLDRSILLAVNQAHTPVLDEVMRLATNRQVWVPFYVGLIIWLIYLFRRRAILLLPLLIGTVSLADGITSRFFKPYFARPRPCHEPELQALLHLPDGCGGQFGFLSSHASNSMALAVFLLLALPRGRYRAVKAVVFVWALLLSYSRVYLGAHYLTDVLGGAAMGAALAGLAAAAFHRFNRRFWPDAA